MPLPQLPVLRPTCSLLPLAHLLCPPVQPRPVLVSILPMRPRLFDSRLALLQPLVPARLATRSTPAKERSKKGGTHRSTFFCFSRSSQIVIVCISKHTSLIPYTRKPGRDCASLK